MQTKLKNKKIISLLLCMMLTVAMAFIMVGCSNNKQDGSNQNQPLIEAGTNSGAENQTTILGEGKTKILFTVVDKDGNETNFEIHTDKETVGDALLEFDLIEGEAGDYGLYVKKVNGITADFDTDGTYWAFYVNGEYASSGVDKTSVKEGEAYSFKVEK